MRAAKQSASIVRKRTPQRRFGGAVDCARRWLRRRGETNWRGGGRQMALAAMVTTGQLPGGRMRGDVSLHVSSAWGDGEPPSRAHKCSPLSKMFPVVEKKTLMKSAPPRVQIGLLVVCSEKKETRKRVSRGAFAIAKPNTAKKAEVPKTANMAKALKKQRSLVEGGPRPRH